MSQAITIDLCVSYQGQSIKEYVLYPKGKPPVCFSGYVLHEHMNNNECKYLMYMTSAGTLIMGYETINLDTLQCHPEEDPSELRLKKLNTLNDVWTFFPTVFDEYVAFLSECAKKLNVPNLFWLKFE